MAGDPVRDAFRSELQSVITAASILWPLKDTLNQDDPINALQSYITLSFFGGTETAAWFGDPGNNGWEENGIVLVVLLAVAGSDTATAETYSATIRDAFRDRRFLTAGGKQIRIVETDPLGGGEDDGVAWSETISLSYKLFNIG